MNYRPDPKQLRLWDTWMFADPDGRRMHLFFLANRPDSSWGLVGHAVSADLVHWEPYPEIPVKSPDDTYDVGIIGTGMVFPAPDGSFMMSYTANIDGPRQRIGFLYSRDLVHWEKRRPEVFIDAQPPNYETDTNKAVSNPIAFRDAFIVPRGDHYEALIAGHSTYGPDLLRGCIARYQSTDVRLANWAPLPPLLGPGVTMLVEVPEYHEIGGRHYLLYSTAHVLGVACNTATRRNCWGTFFAVADTYDGPYNVPPDNLLIGAGSAPPTWQAAIGRIVRWQGEHILYHQIGRPPWTSVGLPKRVVQGSDGGLAASYWPGVEALHHGDVSLDLDRIQVQGENIRVGRWERIGESGVQGSIDGGGSLGLVPGEWEDLHLCCRVTLTSGTRFGITLRDAGRGGPKAGVAIMGDVQHGEWVFGTPVHSWCTWIPPVETVRERIETGRSYRLDLFVRDIYFEAYVDGRWKFTRLIDGQARRGGVGFYVESGEARFEQITVWTLEPMSWSCPDDL